MRFSQLATEDPGTLAVIRSVTGVTALETTTAGHATQLGTQNQRLLDVEAAVATIPPGPTLVLTPDFATTPEDTPANGNVLTNDTTTTGTLRVLEYWVAGRVGSVAAGVRTDIPAVGTFQLYADGEWNFEPSLNYNGPVPLISFQVTNGSDIKISSLLITINSVDDPPVATPNSIMVAINESLSFGVLGNDFDPEGEVVFLTEINGAAFEVDEPVTVAHGTVTVNVNSQLLFVPETDYEGEFSFTYTVSDGTLTAQGTVYVQVGFENIPLFSPVSRIAEGDYFDEANVNFGNTAMGRVGSLYNNGENVSDATYSAAQGNFDLGTREPWLYDRATTIYKLYLRTQDPTIRAKALEYAQLYMSGVVQTFDNADFTTGGGQAGDVKYLYPIIAWWYERETGDTQYRARARGMYNLARTNFPATYAPGAALWTERNLNYAMQACLAQYWLSGEETALTHAEEYFETLLSMSAVSGAPLHPHGQHEGTGITTPITSPWMSALLVETLIQLYRTNSDQRIVEWIARYCDFIVDHAFYVNNEVPEFLGLRVPAYLVGTVLRYPDAGGPFGDSEHSYDVGIMLLKGIWAKQLLSQDISAMQALANECFVVARAVMDDWTRTTVGLPKYRVNPPRKMGWWFGGAYSKIYYAGQVPLGPISLTLPVITGSTPAGSTLTLTPGTYAGSPSPTITHRWVRNAVIIPDETALTYVTQETDVGAQISVEEIATNTGGSIIRMPLLSITPTAVGSPQITSQPQNTTVPAGQDATFTVEFTGTPTPTCQWFSHPSGDPVVGATTNVLTVEDVQIADSGNQFYCDITNSGDTARSNIVTLFVSAQISAVQFGVNDGAYLTNALLPPGPANFTVEALVRIDAPRLSARAMLSNRYIADRVASIGTDNTFEQYNVAVGDSQTGWSAGALGHNPPQGEWYHITISADSDVNAGVFRATLQALADAATQYSQTRAKGFTGTLNHVGFEINGGGATNAGQTSISFQYVRAYATERSLATIAAQRGAPDLTDALFCWVFEDNGSGGVAVRDATGNNRVPTLVGGTLVAGPVVPVL